MNKDSATPTYPPPSTRLSLRPEPFSREPFGRELRVERLRVEQLRVEQLKTEGLVAGKGEELHDKPVAR